MTSSTWWWIGAFVVVDLVLLLVVRAHLAGGEPPSPPPSTGPVADPTAPTAEVTPLLAAAAGGTSLWSSRGDCRTGTDVALSRLTGDDLATLSPGVTEVLRLDVTDAGDVYVVGADADCQVVERVLEDGSDEWRDAVGDVVLWHLVPEVGQAVVTPAATTDPGCGVVALAQDGDSGRVACSDGTTRASADEGGTWQEVGRLDGLQTASVGTAASPSRRPRGALLRPSAAPTRASRGSRRAASRTNWPRPSPSPARTTWRWWCSTTGCCARPMRARPGKRSSRVPSDGEPSDGEPSDDQPCEDQATSAAVTSAATGADCSSTDQSFLRSRGSISSSGAQLGMTVTLSAVPQAWCTGTNASEMATMAADRREL